MHRSQTTMVALLLAAAVAALALSDSAIARDRPGTPNHEFAYECTGTGYYLNYNQPPIICVVFENTATERVRFDVEWMADGVKLSQDDFKGRIECASLNLTTPKGIFNTQCVAGSNLMGFSATTEIGQHVDWRGVAYRLSGQQSDEPRYLAGESFLVKKLEYDTEYCFRFKARKASNGVVSAEWSNWACARTSPFPPKPHAPKNVKATYVPYSWDGSSRNRPIPNHVTIDWESGSDYAAYLEFRELNTSTTRRVSRSAQSYSFPVQTDEIASLRNRSFAICAHNVAGDACSASVHVPRWGDDLERPNHDATEMTYPNRAQEDRRPAGSQVLLPQPNVEQTPQPRGPVRNSAVTIPASGAATPCASGCVWREARGDDHVCVSPSARSRVAEENATMLSHANAMYGPHVCLQGYVWREAFPGDLVCVTSEARALAQQENTEAGSRCADNDEPFRAPR